MKLRPKSNKSEFQMPWATGTGSEVAWDIKDADISLPQQAYGIFQLRKGIKSGFMIQVSPS